MTNAQSYEYDLDSNRVKRVDGGVSWTSVFDRTDQLVSVTTSAVTTNFAYDAYGNLTTNAESGAAVTAMTYNLDDTLTKIDGPGTNDEATFTIDALGRLKTRLLSSSSSTDTYSYAGTSETVVRIANSAGTTTDSITTPSGDRLGVKVGSAVNWFVPDLHGNVAASLIQTEASIANLTRYDAYGRTIATWSGSGGSTPVGEKSWKYQGRLDVSPTGLASPTPLYDMSARYYSPGLGAFTSIDSVLGGAQNPLSLNRYLYALANPVSLQDPSGHYACSGNDPDCAYLQKSVKAHEKIRHAKVRAARERDVEREVTTRHRGVTNNENTKAKLKVADAKSHRLNPAERADSRFLGGGRDAAKRLEDYQQLQYGEADRMGPSQCEQRPGECLAFVGAAAFGPTLALDAGAAAAGAVSTAWTGMITLLTTGSATTTCAVINCASLGSNAAATAAELSGASAPGAAATELGLVRSGERLVASGERAEATAGERLAAACHSFGAETAVATARGAVAISSLKVGDIITSRDANTGEVDEHAITAVMVHIDSEIEHLQIDGETIETTPNHPFLTDKGWLEADALYGGARVQRLDGSFGPVEGYSIEIRPVVMWDLTVSDVHTFAVGEGQWVVHNCDRNYALSNTVASHSESRPYLDSHQLIDEIQGAAKGIRDPGGVSTARRWDVPGFFGGKTGNWELVMNEANDTILHFLFARN
jgi:RHS repeat-associated protein